MKGNLPTLLKAQWDRAIAVTCILGAVIVLTVGYLGISDTPYVAEQLPYFISAGAVSMRSADLRDEGRELRALREQLAASEPPPPGHTAEPTAVR